MVSKKKLLSLGLFLVVLSGLGVAYGTGMLSSTSTEDKSGIIFVSSTEYAVGETGSTIVRVTNANGGGITANWCNVTIYYPDKTTFVNNTAMVQGGSTGSWYSDFLAGSQIGVYEQWVQCQIPPANKIIESSKAFHVSAPLTALNQSLDAPQISILS